MVLMMGCMVLCAYLLPALPSPQPVYGAAEEPGWQMWIDELEALRPQDPMAYFNLAERVADTAQTAEQQALARHLFGLAGALDAARLGRSAAIALADLAPSDAERRRLLALASLLGSPSLLSPELGDVSIAGGGYSDSTVLSLTSAFSYYRRGRGAAALTALREDDAEALLNACDAVVPGGARRFREDCRNYRGQLRPLLGRDELVRMLRLEVGLLAGDNRPWSGDLLLHRGQVLVEVDPSRLDEAFNINRTRAIFRDGQWLPQDNARRENAGR